LFFKRTGYDPSTSRSDILPHSWRRKKEIRIWERKSSENKKRIRNLSMGRRPAWMMRVSDRDTLFIHQWAHLFKRKNEKKNINFGTTIHNTPPLNSMGS
jgi:hypothetical protein